MNGLISRSTKFNLIQSKSFITSTSKSNRQPSLVFSSTLCTSSNIFSSNKSSFLAFSLALYLSNSSISFNNNHIRSHSTDSLQSSTFHNHLQFNHIMAASATNDSNVPKSHGNFDLVKRITMDYAPGMAVEKWKSRETGLTMVWADFESE